MSNTQNQTILIYDAATDSTIIRDLTREEIAAHPSGPTIQELALDE
jgi:hypothetical protein